MMLSVLLVYVLILIIVGYQSSRRIKSEADYYVAGKRLNYWVAAISSRATGESAWLLVGLTGLGWAMGLSGLWVVLGEVAGVTLAWIFLARRTKVLVDRYDAITVPDFLEARYADARHIIRYMAALVLCVSVAFYVAANLHAGGVNVNNFLGWNYWLGLLLCFAIVVGYTVVGGFLAVAWTDLIQGACMFAGLLALPLISFVTAYEQTGGVSELLAALGALPNLTSGSGGLEPIAGSSILGIWRDGQASLENVLYAMTLAGVGLGFLGSPQIAIRFFAIKRQQELRPGALVAVLFTILTDMGAVFAGLFGRVVFSHLAADSDIYASLAGLFWAPIQGVFMVILLAAIMSTADSLLILASSAYTHDLYRKIWRPEASEEKITRLSRTVTLALGVFALLIAIIFELSGWAGRIYWFILLGWSGIAAAFCPAMILSLYWKRTSLAGIVAGMATGFLTVVVWKATGLSDSFYELIPGFFLNLMVTALVSLVTPAPANATADLGAVEAELAVGSISKRW